MVPDSDVRVAFTADDARALPPRNKMAARVAAMGDMARADSPVVRKARVGPFSTTDLDAQLRAAGVTTRATRAPTRKPTFMRS
jgi:hypothetical protein